VSCKDFRSENYHSSAHNVSTASHSSSVRAIESLCFGDRCNHESTSNWTLFYSRSTAIPLHFDVERQLSRSRTTVERKCLRKKLTTLIFAIT